MEAFENTDLNVVLGQMISVARRGGALSLAHFARLKETEISVKGPGDFVSAADVETEELIRDQLAALYPNWGFSGEETGSETGKDAAWNWLVDPIDGTTNFLNGIDYVISIALRHEGRTVCGVVYNPVHEEMFSAALGQGAFLNGAPICVSTVTDPALFAVGTGLPTSNLPLAHGAYERLQAIREPIGAVRVLGCSANNMAFVACGRLTGYFEESGLIDFAAGALLVEEAGGLIRDFWGRDGTKYETSGAIVAGNAAVVEYLIQHTAKAPEPGQSPA